MTMQWDHNFEKKNKEKGWTNQYFVNNNNPLNYMEGQLIPAVIINWPYSETKGVCFLDCKL